MNAYLLLQEGYSQISGYSISVILSLYKKDIHLHIRPQVLQKNLEVPNMLLEISGEIIPERMKGWSQSKNNTQWSMGLVIEARSDAERAIFHRNLEC